MKLFMPGCLHETLKEDISLIDDVVLTYSRNKQRQIRYLHGYVYQIKKNETKKLSET
jgi:hypothetical protein